MQLKNYELREKLCTTYWSMKNYYRTKHISELLTFNDIKANQKP